ncbi:hypothetical protein HYG77_37610 (plasmid) [Rhodococcus sp. ZPP]|nr:MULTISPECIES: hypothetical protein [unclassified Rhodococcus (in: high G+C Gram-positive bacteria)]QHE73680.1 hypothetical protein GFS60_07344 [Rhodococcus sp. WAY2]QTJ71163.1 hypothetical protein HYG77_37610 [Rhodococcus sp. ZPP]
MSQNGADPKGNPDSLTLSEAGKECGVGVAVLHELIRARTLVDGVVRT